MPKTLDDLFAALKVIITHHVQGWVVIEGRSLVQILCHGVAERLQEVLSIMRGGWVAWGSACHSHLRDPVEGRLLPGKDIAIELQVLAVQPTATPAGVGRERRQKKGRKEGRKNRSE